MSFSLAVLLLSPLRAGLTLSFAHAVLASTFPDGRHRRAPPLAYLVGPPKAAHQARPPPAPLSAPRRPASASLASAVAASAVAAPSAVAAVPFAPGAPFMVRPSSSSRSHSARGSAAPS